MLTQCPQCKTTYRLQLEQLKAATGKVRCSRCNTTFDAIENLVEASPDDTPAAPRTQSTETSPRSMPASASPESNRPDDSDTLDAFINELAQNTLNEESLADTPPPPSTLQADIINEAFDALGVTNDTPAESPSPTSPAEQPPAESEANGWDMWFSNTTPAELESLDPDEEMTLPLVEIDTQGEKAHKESAPTKQQEVPAPPVPAEAPKDAAVPPRQKETETPPAIKAARQAQAQQKRKLQEQSPLPPRTQERHAQEKKALAKKVAVKKGPTKKRPEKPSRPSRQATRPAVAEQTLPRQLDLYGDEQSDSTPRVSTKKSAATTASTGKASTAPVNTPRKKQSADSREKARPTSPDAAPGHQADAADARPKKTRRDNSGKERSNLNGARKQHTPGASLQKRQQPTKRQAASTRTEHGDAPQQSKATGKKGATGHSSADTPESSAPSSATSAQGKGKPSKGKQAPSAPAKEQKNGGKPSLTAEKGQQEVAEQKVSLPTPDKPDLSAAPQPGPEAEQEKMGDLSTEAEPRSDEKEGKTPPPSYAMQPELTQAHHGSNLSSLLWGMGIATLCATLLLQFIYFQRLQLANNPQLRPLLSALCRQTGCQLPPRRDVERIEVVEHLMQYHPNYQHGLLLTATLANHADFAQPYPLVEITMTNIEQQVVARRHFRPEQYLSADLDTTALFPANSEVPLLLEVVDPGNEAVGFEFQFY